MRLETSFGAIGLVVLLTVSKGEWRGTIAPDAPPTAGPAAAPEPQSAACTSGAVLVERTRNYEFFGARSDAAGNSLRQRLLVSTDYQGQERRFTGQTDWHIEWRACFEQTATRCTVTGVMSTVNVTYTLPRWADRDSAPPHLRARWDRYITSLVTHEKGHGRIAHEVAHLIDAELVGQSSDDGCDALNDRSLKLVEEVMTRGEAMQRDYDRATFHGTTQGAQFPF